MGPERKRCLLALAGAALGLAIAGCTAISVFSKADFLKNVPVNNVDLTTVPDGTYEGQYTLVLPPGEYAVNRSFDVLVTTFGHAYTAVSIKEPSSLAANSDFVALENRIVSADSLLVDGVSGATYSSRAMLKAVEAAVTR
ncbi:MAG TPA: FMN-binding protein [Spirochaetia bacterium]|nr:FMN-binding protein [Spirochaetia bacterium]